MIVQILLLLQLLQCKNLDLIIKISYDVKKNTTRTDYANGISYSFLSNVEYLLHSANVLDYLILSSNVNYLSMLGITCSPSLQNNVEVSLR